MDRLVLVCYAEGAYKLRYCENIVVNLLEDRQNLTALAIHITTLLRERNIIEGKWGLYEIRDGERPVLVSSSSFWSGINNETALKALGGKNEEKVPSMRG